MTNFMRIGITALAWFLFAHASAGQDSDHRIARAFAESYEPAEQFAQLKDVPCEVVIAFKRLGECDRRASERYLSLIFVKVYRAHLLCCNQSYELRTYENHRTGIDSITDPLLYEFNGITKTFDPHAPIEMISSAIPYTWIKTHGYLRDDPAIKKELAIIKRKEAAIRRGETW